MELSKILPDLEFSGQGHLEISSVLAGTASSRRNLRAKSEISFGNSKFRYSQEQNLKALIRPPGPFPLSKAAYFADDDMHMCCGTCCGFMGIGM